MLKKKDLKFNLDFLIIIFLGIQPLLELYYLYHFDGVESLFSFSPATIIRLFMYLIIIIYFIFKYKKIPIIFATIFILYFVVHSFLLKNIDYFFTTNYSLFSELFYLIRLALPIYCIYVMYKSDYDQSSIYKGLFISCIIFSILMIIPNIFGFALPSYYSTKYQVETNIFGWLNASKNGYNYMQLATKGLFNFTNFISGSYSLVLPVLFISLLKKPSFKKTICILMVNISMLMLGSRVASYVPILVPFVSLIVYLCISFIRKKKINFIFLINCGLILLCTLSIFFISPIRHRSFKAKDNLIYDIDFENLNSIMINYKDIYDSGNMTPEKKEEIVKYILNNTSNYLINSSYVNSYSPKYDLEFWINYYLLDENVRADNRNIQKSIINRIYEKNLTTNKILFGFSYSATYNNGIFIEKDIVSQFFYLGIFGLMIFIFPYLAICIYSIYMSLINIKKIDFETTMILFSIILTICISVFSGHVLDQFVTTIPLGILSGYLLKRVNSLYSLKIKNSSNIYIDSVK